ncbi:MAG: asparagine synthase (glutamine-hydrolyzing) [Lachnospiraceae bacterium]|nr:asparagine synthase (glutamine-hydrolyzing) [Lachnospiraceae bacterium]
MCGICGFIGKTKEEIDREKTLNAMMDRIIHRGPDQEGKYLNDSVALGFRRLSINDLDHGMQPMYNETGDVAIVFNGEIYNYPELRKELEAKGHVFANNADTESLVHGYEEWGTELLQKVRGMFAFMIYDMKKDIIFAARDFFGIKPFYYSNVDDVFVFGSEIKSIIEFPGVKREVNDAALEQYMSFQYSVLPETFFKGIYKVPAGHYLWFEGGKMDVVQYYDPLMQPEKKPEGLEKTVDEIEALIHESTNAHMLADVEVGASLSSGVDSSYLVSEFPGEKTYTVGFLDKESKYNEIRYAEDLCEALGNKKNISKTISADEYFDSIPKIMYFMDEPLADPSCIALYFVDELAAKDIKVVLSGEGADEFFGGYNIYHEPFSLAKYQKLPKGLRKGVAKVAEKMPRVKGRNFLIRGAKLVEERFIGNANLFSVKERESILKSDLTHVTPAEIVAPYYKKCEGLSDIAKMQYIDMNFWLQGDILLKADKMSMAHSLEARVPYLDKVVFEYAKYLPIEYKVTDTTTKMAFREAAKRHIPEFSASKKKLGFPVPIRVWLKEDKYYNKVLDTLTSDVAKEYFNQDEVVKLMEDHRDGKADNSRKIWAIYVFLIWHQVYIEDENAKMPA